MADLSRSMWTNMVGSAEAAMTGRGAVGGQIGTIRGTGLVCPFSGEYTFHGRAPCGER